MSDDGEEMDRARQIERKVDAEELEELLLRGIDEVAWGDYEHAYGSAEDVPEQLRALAGPDPQERKRSQWALYGNLWHQGTVYEATQHAVPFLIALLSPGSRADRAWTLVYLSHLATGASYLDVHQDLCFYESQREDPEFKGKIQEELDWVRGARAAVCEGISTYMGLLAADDAEVRAAAIYLLASLAPEASRAERPIRLLLCEDLDEIVRSAALEGLLCLATERSELLADAKKALSDPSSLVRWTAARVLAIVGKEDMPSRVLHVLLNALEDPGILAELYVQSPFCETEVAAATSYALSRMPRDQAVLHLPVILTRLDEASPEAALDIAAAALSLAFVTPLPSGRPFEELEACQKEVLETLAYSDPAWGFNANMAQLLRSYGLPDWFDKLQDFCGLSPKKIGGIGAFVE